MPTNYAVDFYNADGRLVYTSNLNTALGLNRYPIDIANDMRAGLYYIKILQAGEVLKVEKLVIMFND